MLEAILHQILSNVSFIKFFSLSNFFVLWIILFENSKEVATLSLLLKLHHCIVFFYLFNQFDLYFQISGKMLLLLF